MVDAAQTENGGRNEVEYADDKIRERIDDFTARPYTPAKGSEVRQKN
jgi:hypothetical protein